MSNRLGIVAAAITAGLLVTGIAWAGSDTEATTNIELAANQEIEIPVEDAGSVRLGNTGTSLTILSTVAAEGFVVEVEVPQGREVEADFRGEGRRLKFNAELEDVVLEDGVVWVRIGTEVEAEGSVTVTDETTSTTTDTTTPATSATVTTTPATTTSTTVDDNGDGDGEGDDDEGDDNEGMILDLPIGPVTYDVSGAGSVTVVFLVSGQIELGVVNPASGWSVEEIRQHDDEVEVRLRNGEEEARLRVRIDDGRVRVETERKD